MSSQIGNRMKVSIFGESHGVGIGAVIDGISRRREDRYGAAAGVYEAQSAQAGTRQLLRERKVICRRFCQA